MKKSIFNCIVLISLSLFISCEKEPIESNWQVYIDTEVEKFTGSYSFDGLPMIPTTLLEGGHLPGAIFFNNKIPSWTIKASIRQGILSIDFPETMNLTDEYSSDYTDGIKISSFLFYESEILDNQSFVIRELVFRRVGVSYSDVRVYYVDKDFNYTTDKGVEVQLKAGWNFWDHKNRILSQDINVFFNKNYRWHWRKTEHPIPSENTSL